MLVYWRVYPQEWNKYEKMNQFVQNNNRKRRERTVRNQQIMGAKKKISTIREMRFYILGESPNCFVCT
jgi:hypothetical protein